MGDRHDAAVANAVANNTIGGLLRSIKARMADIAARFPLSPTKDADVTRVPDVRIGWLPPKTGSDDAQYPFILVRPRNGGDTEQGADQQADARVDLIVGTYSDDDEGVLDVVAVVDAIRENLDATPVLDRAFEQVGPMTWSIPEEQARPQWLGVVTTNWIVPRPRRVTPDPIISEE